MATLLDDLAVRQYIDPVRMPDPGQTVRDEEHATPQTVQEHAAALDGNGIDANIVAPVNNA